MDPAILQRIEHASPALFGMPLDALLAPIPGLSAAGSWARGSGVYHALKQARSADDTSLPLGAWEHELKRADWDKASRVAADALAHQSKDLQLAAWLLEAQIHRHGYAGIAAPLYLLQQLCVRYWNELHPPMEDGLAYRANIFRWINDKLPLALRQVPLAPAPQHSSYGLADWDRARRYEQLRQAQPDTEAEGASVSELAAAMGAAPSANCAAMEMALSDALAVLGALDATLSTCFGAAAPGLSGLRAVLEQARALLDAELYRRGERRAPAAPAGGLSTLSTAAAPSTAPASAEHAAPLPPLAGAAPQDSTSGGHDDRRWAYAMLNEAAAMLLRLEPHSPVPYLVRRASQWGELNAADLYQELFLRLGGQLNIFDMMGLEAPGAPAGQ